MANALTLPHILEITFDSLTAVVGVVVLLLALRVAPTLTLFAHRRALWISIGAAALIVASQLAEVWADFSRLSTLKDAAGDFAELLAICPVGLGLRLMSRAEKEEISFLRRAANVDDLTGLGSRSFFHRAAGRRIELYGDTVCPSPAPCLMWTTSRPTTTAMGTGQAIKPCAA